MKGHDSYVEFALGLFDSLFKDCESQYPALAKEFKRDQTRLRSAVESHGLRFILETMPAWRKHLDKCLAEQRLTRSHYHHFGNSDPKRVIPRFLRGLTLRVFDHDGTLKPDPDVQAIRCLRQLLGVARRLRVDCKPKSRSDAVREFVRTDLEVKSPSLDWSRPDDFDGSKSDAVSFTDIVPDSESSKQGIFPGFEVSSLGYKHAECIQQCADYMSSCLGSFNPLDWRFRHGPGALSDRRFGTHKYEFTNWPDRLDSVFPMADFACANYAVWQDSSLYKTHDWEIRKEYPAKLCCVPKTIVAPRLIASEPTALQWCQQGIRDFLYTRVRRSHIGAFVDFGRQDLNGSLALEASHSGSHCTIDLSSASDRISCWHVERLFRRSPSLLDACRATRSMYIQQDICRRTPKQVMLRKYSTMGNATTFPVQSIFFLAIVLGTLHYVRGIRVSSRSIRSLGTKEVRVFGDDLIVPNDCAAATVGALSALGLKVNAAKTFMNGLFRESCGVDAYAGHDVTTVSVLTAPIQAGPGSIVSSVDVHNNFCSRGWYNAAHWIRKTVQSLGKYKIREIAHGSGLFGWYPNYIDDEPRLKTRFNRHLQVREVRCHNQSVKDRVQPSAESAALLQFFTEAAKVVERNKSSLHFHLQRAKSSLRLGWVALS